MTIDEFRNRVMWAKAYWLMDACLEVLLLAVREEREACAALCEQAAIRNWNGPGGGTAPEELAKAIRARGQ